MSYLGRSAKLSLKAQEKVSFLATAGQTSKTGLSYTPSFIEVYVNGVLLTDTTDFTATNGNSITFTVALLVNDEVTVISLKTFTVADHYTKSDADALRLGTQAFNRSGSDGTIVDLQKDGTSVGSIQSRGSAVTSLILDPRSSGCGLSGTSNAVMPTSNTGAIGDANTSMDLGASGYSFRNAYLSGGVYLGGTGAANLLDDYEFGTWTPVLTSAGSASNQTTSHADGSYTKVGRLVTAVIRFRTTNNGTDTGQFGITLPFVVGNNLSTTGLEGAASLANVSGVSVAHSDLSATPIDGQNQIWFYYKSSSTSTTVSQLLCSHTDNIFDGRATVTYMT